ncbi:histidinol dehydrogenase [Candidatus Oleimmundimicrobium sp.]|uniref:histidinol dehydrogenase n=1 Tax=Candidatus Oleimmundimicrobium sp. TaxID=3060597 RepID=UPI00272836E1|nr:histidinol dehydrogenase [Candidatus Oleimmundimicrobium sp.]MDO8886632.1 histidinol dehydrogenase [Candidatus Oleimmundimicrobium sp.]
MIIIKEISSTIKDEELKKLFPSRILDESKLEIVQEIVNNVRRKGDSALLEYTRKFDGINLKSNQLKVGKKEFEEAYGLVDKEFNSALKLAKKRIVAYHENQKIESWFTTEEDGVLLGQQIRPIERVGIYVPGGMASYPSSVLMNAIPAKVAGVSEIAMCVPPDKNGRVNPYTLVAACEVGVDEVYRVGGAQAIAAMAYGTETIKKVYKITGPGNIYVTLAKKLVIGEVGIDMLAGPSEVVILADGKANPAYIAADMLAQAEHAPDATSVLITTSSQLAENVNAQLDEQLEYIGRKGIAEKSIRNFGRILLADSLGTMIRLANFIAPEHLEIMIEKPMSILGEIKNAGAIFLGAYTPESVGDYVAGPNHILPTSGTARFYSPLGVYDFIKRSSVLSFTKEGLREVVSALELITKAEGLDAHARSAKIRVEESD